MALTEENGMVMPVQPMGGGNFGGYGGYGYPAMPMMPYMPYGNGGGMFGGGDSWLGILFLIALCNGGFGFGGFGGGWGGMMGMGMMDGFGLYPWLNNSQHISDGFRDQQLNNQISDTRGDINRGFGDVQLGIAGVNQNICQTGNGIVSAVTGAQNAIAQQLYSNQISDLERSFAAQTSTTAGMNNIAMNLQNCCCENRAATADLKYTVATENCADRYEAAKNTRDIIDSQTRGTQAILDKLCALELDGVKAQLAQAQRENVGLQNAVNMATFRESQANQNALFAQGLTNEVDALYNRLKNCPVNTVPVAGNTPLFSCNPSFNGNNGGCGCNGGYGFANG